MAARRRAQSKRRIESYDHRDKGRLNNPPVGLVTPDTDKDAGKRTCGYDPHVDPQLRWAGKAEIDEDLIDAYPGAVSLRFEAGEHRRFAVKIVDERGNESPTVMELAR